MFCRQIESVFEALADALVQSDSPGVLSVRVPGK